MKLVSCKSSMRIVPLPDRLSSPILLSMNVNRLCGGYADSRGVTGAEELPASGLQRQERCPEVSRCLSRHSRRIARDGRRPQRFAPTRQSWAKFATMRCLRRGRCLTGNAPQEHLSLTKVSLQEATDSRILDAQEAMHLSIR